MYDFDTQNFCAADTERFLMATPWAQYVTPDDQDFSIGTNMQGAPAIGIYRGDREVHAHHNTKAGTIDTWFRPSGNADSLSAAPFQITLKSWRRIKGRPKLTIHPIGLLHLYAAGSITEESLQRLMLPKRSICCGTWLTQADPIVSMLRLRQLPLYVCTSVDLSVRAA